MSRYIDIDKVLMALRLDHKDVIYIDKKDTARRIEKIQGIDIVRCKECKHRTYCYGDVLWTNKRQTVDIHKTVDFCSLGEREGE